MRAVTSCLRQMMCNLAETPHLGRILLYPMEKTGLQSLLCACHCKPLLQTFQEINRRYLDVACLMRRWQSPYSPSKEVHNHMQRAANISPHTASTAAIALQHLVSAAREVSGTCISLRMI